MLDIKIEAHLSLEELEQYYCQAKDGVKRSQYQMIWLLAQGKRSIEWISILKASFKI